MKENKEKDLTLYGTGLGIAHKTIESSMVRFENLVHSVEQWAQDKGILSHATPIGQAMKTIEEAQEIADAIENEDKDEIIDGIGDTLVTLIIQAKMQRLDLLDCLESAYNVIANRTGKIKNGQFVKDE